MKLLLDEMLAPEIARRLRKRGHDVVAIAEREAWVSYSDDGVMALAGEEHRAVVTNNLRDFRPRAAVAALPGGLGHYGLVCIPSIYRRTKAATARIARALEEKLAARTGDDDLYNQETWVA